MGKCPISVSLLFLGSGKGDANRQQNADESPILNLVRGGIGFRRDNVPDQEQDGQDAENTSNNAFHIFIPEFFAA